MSTNKLLIGESPLQVLPSLACAIGLNEAMLLQQMHYWVDKSNHIHDGKKWIYNSIPQWNTQFPFWGESTIKRTIGNLEKKGLIVTADYNPDRRNRSKWYSIDYDALNTILAGYDNITDETISEKLTEQNSEINEQGKDDAVHQVKLTQCIRSKCTGAKWTDASVQNDPMHQVKLTRCIYKDTENTTETTTEIKKQPPLPPCRGRSSEPAGKNKTAKPEQLSEQDYQAALEIYNDTVADRLPRAVELNKKRLRGFKRLMGQLARKDLEGFRTYVQAFVANAPPFYFGENERGWAANLDYLLRAETLTKVREGTY